MRRSARWVLLAVAVQAALVGIYWFVEHQRQHETSAPGALGKGPPRRVQWRAPRLTAVWRDGSAVNLSTVARPALVHVWATWCPPCRAELPGLLALPAGHAVQVLAVALDEDWDVVERFLSGLTAGQQVVLAEADEVERALGVTKLPVTLLLPGRGRTALRFDGARDWTDETFVKTYLGDVAKERRR